MFRSKYLLVLLLIIPNIIICSSNVSADTKEDDIKKLLDITMTDAFVETWTNAFMQLFAEAASTARTSEEKAIIDRIYKETRDVVISEFPRLIDQMVPLYDKHFTHDEIKQLIEFNESPVGKKAIEKMPILTQQGMELGKVWGAGLGPLIQKRLKDKGILE